jgi:dienelactone hydrolase
LLFAIFEVCDFLFSPFFIFHFSFVMFHLSLFVICHFVFGIRPLSARSMEAASGANMMKNERWKMKNGKWTLPLVLIAFVWLLPLRSDAQSRVHSRPASTAERLADGVRAKEIHFYSEGIQCFGKIFSPDGVAGDTKMPAVVLAPDAGQTAASIEKYAARFAKSGIVAMVIDYRGWGKSGGFLQTVDPVKTDDRLRFSQMTARVRISRKRVIPQQQILDIRNALYYLQGEAGVDRTRVGVWGTGMSGGHVVVLAATDSRIKAAVAQFPIIAGKDIAKRASAPTGALLQAEQSRARNGGSNITSASSRFDADTRLALAEYHPFWYLEQIPKTTAVLFLSPSRDTKGKEETDAVAASKLLKGPTEVVTIDGANLSRPRNEAAFSTAAKTAAEWMLKHL